MEGEISTNFCYVRPGQVREDPEERDEGYRF